MLLCSNHQDSNYYSNGFLRRCCERIIYHACHCITSTVLLSLRRFCKRPALAEWGFCSQSAIRHIEVSLQRAKGSGLSCPDLCTFVEQCKVAYRQLFHVILNNTNHVLDRLTPPRATALSRYKLRPHAHERQLPLHNRLLD